jgi:hypothetical protein
MGGPRYETEAAFINKRFMSVNVVSDSGRPSQSGHGGCYVISPYNMSFCKPFDEIGKVTQVLTENTGCDSHGSMALMLNDETRKQVLVHLGPVWYLERLRFDLVPGDMTEVKGISKMEKNGRLSVVAYELIKGDEVLVLRDSRVGLSGLGRGTPSGPAPDFKELTRLRP